MTRSIKTAGVRTLRCMLIAGASAAAMSATAFAQGGSSSDTAEVPNDEILVTGSRIARDPADLTVPLTEIGAEEFQTRAFVNTLAALEDLPLVGPGVSSRGNSTQNGDNNAYVDLLNFGTQRTLTLLDGRRMVSSNQGTVFVPGNATGSQIDLTIINPLLIKSTEVQIASAGAIYGADAVAGVVNVILDRDFTGFKANAQGGLTQRGDGGQYQFGAAYGKELFGGKGHVVIAGEYLNDNGIIGGPVADDPRSLNDNYRLFNNPISANSTDGFFNQVWRRGTRFNQIPTSGVLALGQVNAGFAGSTGIAGSSGDTTQFFFPTRTANSANDTAFNTFRSAATAAINPGGLDPWNWALANPTLAGINPLLFVGTFGIPSGFLSVPNTDPVTLAYGLSRRAVPLTFDASGNPVAYDIGSFIPGNIADQTRSVGGQGFAADQFNNLRADQERFTGNMLWKYEFNPSFRYEGDAFYSRIENVNVSDGQGSQTPGCATSGGNCGVPIFVDQNPFVTPATLALVNAHDAANPGATNASLRLQTIGGQRFFSLTRSLDDITGGFDNTEGNRSTTFATTHAFLGDFAMFDREFTWDLAARYSRNTSKNTASVDILDIEFALATDVVTGPGGQPVCRQQTLGAPEAVNVRNPRLTNINIATGLVPTAAQIAACKPLNLFGAGRASQEAIDYVTTRGNSENEATQWYAAGSLGGDIINLPGGMMKFNAQVEYRAERLIFTPNDVFRLGLGRQTIGQPSDGKQRFIEGGFEVAAPVLDGDEGIPLMKGLEFTGAVRVVNRTGSGTPNGIANPRVSVDSSTALTFVAGGRWTPIDGLTFRGNRSRSVRSPSIVEALGAPQTGFSNLTNAFPCNAINRNNGPASGIRITNCNAFEASKGLPAGTFAALSPALAAVPAGVGGNPGLLNEVSNNWSVGAVWQPDFLPNFSIQADWVNLNLQGTIGLNFLGGQCFDSADFPNTEVGGVRICETINLAIPNPLNPAEIIQPPNGLNFITGNPLTPPAIPGALAPVQSPYSVATGLFSNLNQGGQRLQALNTVIRYNFDVADFLGEFMATAPTLGRMTLQGTVFYLDKFETSQSGTFVGDINVLDGEPGNSRFQTRLDVAHKIGPVTQAIQWQYDSKTRFVAESTGIPETREDFLIPDQNFFNYSIAWDVNDNFTVRGIVNNLTDARVQPDLGSPQIGDLIGRNFVVRIDATF